jgi:hypothetical protein
MTRVRLVALATMLVLAGCSSSDGDDSAAKTFRETDFGIEFSYPGELREIQQVPVAEAVGSRPAREGAIGLSAKEVILVERYDLHEPIGRAELALARAELDALLARTSFEVERQRTTTIDGRPALEYEGRVGAPTNAHSRLVVIFDGDREYFLNCQWVNERKRIESACDQAIRTMRVQSSRG